jgi:hypothetical protein
MIRKPVHFSQLKHMAHSPAHYQQAAQGGWHDALHLRIGSGAHAIAFDQPVAVYPGKVRRGKEWDAFKEDNADALWLSRTEHAQALVIADAIRGHREASELLFVDDSAVEKRIEWSLLGRECAGTPDVRTASYIVDLKTTKCSHPERFTRDATFRNYHAQLAWYLDGVRLSGLGTPTEAYIVAVESTPPHPVTVLRLTDKAIDQGRRLCRIWLERVLGCERDNRWPGYCESIVPFDVDEPLELQFGDDDDDADGTPSLRHALQASVEEMDAAF